MQPSVLALGQKRTWLLDAAVNGIRPAYLSLEFASKPIRRIVETNAREGRFEQRAAEALSCGYCNKRRVMRQNGRGSFGRKDYGAGVTPKFS